MPIHEIDRIQEVYAECYCLEKWSEANPGHRRMWQERNKVLARSLTTKLKKPLSECKLLDVGCGAGGMLAWIQELGAQAPNLFGIDLLSENIESARKQYPGCIFEQGNAEKLTFPSASFDIVIVSTVFSSVLEEKTAANIAREITRVLKADGVIAWYDIRYPNPKNLNVRAMTKRRIRKLFPGFALDLEPLTLLPPIAYRLGRHTDRLYSILAAVSLFRSHYGGLLSRRSM
jgi:ubiquinone/menaquinone biosynthesis C-methylase UbiE